MKHVNEIGGLLEAKDILVRGTNWIGDVVMSLPALETIRKSVPHARITVLAKPWVADIYRLVPGVDEVMIYRSPGIHEGLVGKWRLADELKSRRFHAAVLFQNAFEAALITAAAGIPIRAGYTTDGRRLLLTHPVKKRKGVESLHQVHYYRELVQALGFLADPGEVRIYPSEKSLTRADEILRDEGVEEGERLVGMAPGAAYGPAKMWYPERFAAAADRLSQIHSTRTLLFGSGGDSVHTAAVGEHMQGPFIDFAGRKTLAEVTALISRCNLFISNDSGLMHLAGALGVPLVAVFGSTNPKATSPLGSRSHVIYKKVSCSPCLKKTCPTDFRCMDAVTADEVVKLADRLLAEGGE